jgi:hypothetical protein
MEMAGAPPVGVCHAQPMPGATKERHDVRILMPTAITALVLAGGLGADAGASHYCQTIRTAGFVVKVRVQRGTASCREAKAVIAGLFAHPRRAVRGWSCVGPQTLGVRAGTREDHGDLLMGHE